MENYSLNSKSGFWSNLIKGQLDQDELITALMISIPFQTLSKVELKELKKIIHFRKYRMGEHIFYENDPGIALYLILKGKVKVVSSFNPQNSYLIGILSQNEIFGEIAMVDGDTRLASVIAETDCSLAALFKPDLDSFSTKHPRAGLQITTGISKVIALRFRTLSAELIKMRELLNLS